METVNPVLARKLGHIPSEPAPEAVESAASPMRKMRRALGRAADKAVGLSASVLGIAEEESDAEALIEAGPEGWVVLGLRDGTSAGLSGLFMMDPALRSALIEMQTIGSLLPPPDQQRPVTRTDAVITIPFASHLLRELAEVDFGSGGFDPAAFDIGPMDNLRTAGLVMLQGHYQSWRITIQMGGEAQGEMWIAIRPTVTPPTPPAENKPDWSHSLRAALEEAPADLDAVLTRMTLPFHMIEDFEVGQVLTLAGTTVGSVTLTGPGGEGVAMARLGQVAGKRAVRIERAQVELQDVPTRIGTAPMDPSPSQASDRQGDARAPKDDGAASDLVDG